MTEPTYPTASSAAAAQRAAGPWRYLRLFGLQTIGAFILLWTGVPLYRKLLADPTSPKGEVRTLVWALLSIALIQVGYWICYRFRPPLPRWRNALVGTVTLFIARMTFVFASALFGVVFVTQTPGFDLPVSRDVVTLMGLFSLFCYVQELERLGRSLLGRAG